MNALILSLIAVLSLGTAEPGPLDTARSLLRAGKADAALGLLASTWPTLTRDRDKVQARYLLGRELIRRGSAAGLEHVDVLPRPFGALEDRRLVWRARGLALTSRYDEAILALDLARGVAANKRERGELDLERARIYRAAERPKKALEIYQAVAGREFERVHRAAALGEIVALTLGSQAGRARAATRTLLIHLPETAPARSGKLAYGPADLSTRDRVKRARVLVSRFEYEEAREILRPLIGHKTYGSEARWLVGLIGIKKLRDAPDEARRLLERVAASRSEHAEEALFLLMRTFIKEDRYEDAVEVGRRYHAKYPRGAYVARVAYYRAWLPYDERRCDVAVPRLKSYLSRFKYRRTYALGFLGWCGIRDGKWAQAVRDYEGLAKISGALHQGKAWYWQAYALEKLGKPAEARAKLARLSRYYPLTWYEVLGRQRIAAWEGEDPRASALQWPQGGDVLSRLPASQEAWSWPKLSERLQAPFDRVHELVLVDEVDLARAVYTPIRERVEGTISSRRRDAFIRFMGHAVDDHKHGWVKATGAHLSGLMALPEQASERWIMGYPMAYQAIVESGAPGQDVPPLFVYSIMRQESRYHPSMISARDAIGALQMIPQTALLVGRDMGQAYDPSTFSDPRVGFPFSFFYMGAHARLWRRQWPLVAASYNAGPAPVLRWVEENPEATLDFLVEEFSYNEARAYTRKVSEHMLRYLWLYVPDAKERGIYLDQLFPLTVQKSDPDVEVY